MSAHVARVLLRAVPTKVADVALTQVGASFWGVTLMWNVWAALVSCPPFAVVPLSWSSTPIVAVPFAFGARL